MWLWVNSVLSHIHNNPYKVLKRPDIVTFILVYDLPQKLQYMNNLNRITASKFALMIYMFIHHTLTTV